MKKIGLFAGFIVGFWLVAVAIRTSMDPQTGMEFANGMSALPFAGFIFAVLNSFMHVDTSLFAITSSPFFLISLLILVLQGALQSPLMLLINYMFGPFLFAPSGRGYSLMEDPSYARTKNKLINNVWKLIGSLTATICIVLFCAWLVNYALDWVNGQMLLWRILIYVAAVAVVALIVALPFVVTSQTGHALVIRLFCNAGQSILYAFLTNACVIAVVAAIVAGRSVGQIAVTVIVFMVWMVVYTDTDGMFIRGRA